YTFSGTLLELLLEVTASQTAETSWLFELRQRFKRGWESNRDTCFRLAAPFNHNSCTHRPVARQARKPSLKWAFFGVSSSRRLLDPYSQTNRKHSSRTALLAFLLALSLLLLRLKSDK